MSLREDDYIPNLRYNRYTNFVDYLRNEANDLKSKEGEEQIKAKNAPTPS